MPAPYKKHKKSKADGKDQEERDLESLLFGDLDDSVWDKVGREVDDHDDDQGSVTSDRSDQDEPTFFLDASPEFTLDTEPTRMEESDAEALSDEDEEANEVETEDDSPDYIEKSAWVDEDDANLKVSLKGTDRLRKLRKTEEEDLISGAEYERRLRKQASKIYPRPQWAMLPEEKQRLAKKRKPSEDASDAEESDSEQLDDDARIDLLKSTYGIVSNRRMVDKLQPGFIDIARMSDANQTSRSNGIISSVAFHPNANVLLTASLDKTLRLFQIDGKVNPKIHSAHFKHTPIHSAAFHPSGDQIVLTSRRKHYHIYDVQAGAVEKCPGIWGSDARSLERFTMSPCGNYMAFLGISGNITLVSYRTKQWVGNLKMNGHVISVDWSPDGKFLFAIGDDGFFYQFDIGERRCVKRWQDVDSYNPTRLRVSPNMNYIATGLGSGIVNFYDQSVLDSENCKAAMTVNNLTTTITDIKFNHDSQLVALSSSKQSDAFRLAHLPSGKVFSNWPTERTPLNKVTAVDFSADSNYMAIGNVKGNVLLYALKHYIQ